MNEEKMVQFMSISLMALKAADCAQRKCDEIESLDKKADDLIKEIEGEFHINLTGNLSPAHVMLELQRADMSEETAHRFMQKLMTVREITSKMSGLSGEVMQLKKKVDAARQMLSFMRAMDGEGL